MRQERLPFESRVEREFNAWIDTPDGLVVVAEAVRRARALKAKGFRRFSTAAIFDSIRYDWSVGLVGDGKYRLNNHYTSFLARLLMRNYPDLAGFFEIRRLRGRA